MRVDIPELVAESAGRRDDCGFDGYHEITAQSRGKVSFELIDLRINERGMRQSLSLLLAKSSNDLNMGNGRDI